MAMLSSRLVEAISYLPITGVWWTWNIFAPHFDPAQWLEDNFMSSSRLPSWLQILIVEPRLILMSDDLFLYLDMEQEENEQLGSGITFDCTVTAKEDLDIGGMMAFCSRGDEWLSAFKDTITSLLGTARE